MKTIRFGHIPSLIVVTLAFVLSAALNGVSIYTLRFITDFGLSGDIERMMETVKILLVVLLAIFLIELISINLKSRYLKKSLIMMKSKYVSLLMLQDITQLKKEDVAMYRSNLTNDFDRYEEKFLQNLLNLIQMVLQFGVALVLVGLIEPTLIFGAFGLLIIFAYITGKSSKPIQKQEEKKSVSLEAYTGFVEETLQGFAIIKQHQLEKKREAEFKQKATQVQLDNYDVDVKSTQVDALNNLIQNTVMFSGIVGSLLVARAYGSSLGSILVVASSFGHIMWPIQQFTPILTAMNGIKIVVDTFEKNLQRPQISRPKRVDHVCSLQFEECDLGYDDAPEPILRNVNITIQEGEKILIVGVSGAGKSTILKTLRQSIQPKLGMVTLNGHDIYEIDAADYYGLFSVIDQIGFIFNESVKNNVTLFQNISEETITQIMHAVGLQDMELSHPLTNNGANISGGQRARLMLARALCLHSQVILCDEIFASLPQDVAKAIEHDILALNKTIINVSHIIFKEHLNQYDKIYIVENGTTRLASSLEEVWERMILSQD